MDELRKAAQQALEALTESVDAVRNEYVSDWRHGIPSREGQLAAMSDGVDKHEAAIRDLRAALAAPPEPPPSESDSRISTDFAIVPKEPTDEMLVRGQEAWMVIRPKRNALEDCTEAAAVYRAMVAAAPAAPAAPIVEWLPGSEGRHVSIDGHIHEVKGWRAPTATPAPVAWIDAADFETLAADGWCVVRATSCDPGADHRADVPLFRDGASAAPAEPPPEFTVRQMIEGAWCAGYYDAGYTHDSGYACAQAEKCADEFLAAVPAPVPPQFQGDAADAAHAVGPSDPSPCGSRPSASIAIADGT